EDPVVAGVAVHAQRGAAAPRMLPELRVRPGRLLTQMHVVVEGREPCPGLRPRQQIRRPAIAELAQVARAAEGAAQAHSVQVRLRTGPLLVDDMPPLETVEPEPRGGRMRLPRGDQMREARTRPRRRLEAAIAPAAVEEEP